MKTKLFVKVSDTYISLDLYDDIVIPLTFNVSDVKDISKKSTNYSKTFTIPCTERNMGVLGGLDINEISGVEFSKKYPCVVHSNGLQIFSGDLVLNSIVKENHVPVSYNVSISSIVKSLLDKLANKTFADINWGELKIDSSELSPVNIINHWYGDQYLDQFEDGAGLTLIDRVNNIGNKLDYWRSKDLSPMIYLNKILDKIITQSGYHWDSRFFNHHYNGQWDDYDGWINGASDSTEEYPVKDVRNVGKFDSRQFVIPSQVDPSQYPWDKVVPANVIVDNYIKRSYGDGELSYFPKSKETYENATRVVSDYYNRFKDGAVADEYMIRSDNAAGGGSTTAPIPDQYYFRAPTPGWYEISFDFDWRFLIGKIRHTEYNSDGDPYLDPDELTYGKLKVYDDTQKAYDISFEMEITGQSNRIIPMYSNEASWRSLLWKDSESNYLDISYPYCLIAWSKEFEQNNTEGSDVINVSSNGWRWNKPVKFKKLVYLYENDCVYLYSKTNFYNGYVDEDSNHSWEINLHRGTRRYSATDSLLEISARPDSRLFSATLVDKVGPYRGINPEVMFDNNIKQVDFFTSIVKMFNLYVEDVSGKPIKDTPLSVERLYPDNTLLIEPGPVYYNIGANNWESQDVEEKYSKFIVPFTDFVDFKTVSYHRPEEFLYKNLIFRMGDADDYFSKLYLDKTKKPLGELKVYSTFESQSEESTDIIFANTTNVPMDTQHDERTLCMPAIFSLEEGIVNTSWVSPMHILNKYKKLEPWEGTESNGQPPRIYYDHTNYFAGNQVCSVFDADIRLDDNQYRRYGYSRLEFGTREYYLETLIEGVFDIPGCDLFNTFYKSEYDQLTKPDARILSCQCYIPANIINNLKLYIPVEIGGNVYYIVKIQDWINEDTPCDCEFLKINDSWFSLYKPCPTPNNFTLQTVGVVTDTNTGSSVTNNYNVEISNGGGDYRLAQNRENIYLMSQGVAVSSVTVPEMVGTQGVTQGKSGLVPAPGVQDAQKFLRGDGTWANTGGEYTLDSTDGISVDLYENNQLKDHVPIDTFLGADAQNVGTPGLVPVAQINDRTKFLRGDGTWQPAGGSGSYEIENDPQDSMVINLKSDGVVSSYANIPEYEACSQQYPGEYGAVHPAPQGAMDWYFGGDAQWRPIPTEAYVLQFTKHANLYTLDNGNYVGAVSALNAGKPVFAILNDEDSSQDGDKIVYGDAHWYADDAMIILHSKPNDSNELYLELYSGDSFDFYSNTVRNFGRLSVNGSSYQSSAPNTTLTLNDGTGISLNRTNAAVTFNLKQATNQEIGGIKVSSTQAPGAGSMATSGMRRPVQVDSNGNASVLVDYQSAGEGLSLVNNAFVLNQATDQALGGIKVSSTQASQIGSVAQGTVRPVQLDANGVAGVAIPDITVISPLMDTGNGITCKAADIDDTPYRKGLGYLDYTEEYVQRAGCVTPMAAVDTDKYGEEALKSWKKIDGAYIQPMGSFYFAAPKSGAEFYALPITMIRTKDGPVPVLLVNRDIYRMLNNYILNETPVIVSE